MVLPFALSLLLPAYEDVVPLVAWLLLPACARAVFGNPVLILTVTQNASIVARVSLIGAVACGACITLAGAVGGVPAAAAAAGLGFAVSWAGLWWRCRVETGVDTSICPLVVAAPTRPVTSLPEPHQATAQMPPQGPPEAAR